MSRYFRHMLYRWQITPEDAARYTGEDIETINEWRRDGVKVPRERRILPFLISQAEYEFYKSVGDGPVAWTVPFGPGRDHAN